MSKRFFALEVDVYVPGRWYLSEPTSLAGPEAEDIWQFLDGKPMALNEGMRVPVYRPGKPLDIDFAGAGQAPVVSVRAAAVFQGLAPDTVQLFPVEVERQSAPYYLLNISWLVDAVDERACQRVERWRPEDGRPDKVGEFHVIEGLRIDASKAGSARVFRLRGYSLPIIVAEEVKARLDEAGCLGGKFTEV